MTSGKTSLQRGLFSGLGLLLLAVGFVAFLVVNNLMFGSQRLDLTEGKLYTVSEGSRNILGSLEEPVNLYFFYSDKATRGMNSLRDYAQRVRELLEEFELVADGKIHLQVIDPEPFSEAEDRAAAFGLQGVQLELGAGDVYFGLVGTNAVDGQEIIPFFQPDQEAFLEYEISKLVYNLANPEQRVIGLLSDLDIQGGFDMMTRQPKQPWQVIAGLQDRFEIRELKVDMDQIDDDVDLLLVVHPKVISDTAMYAIDQYVLRGGKAMIFVDPFSDQDQPQSMQDPTALPGRSSQLNRLFEAWGVTMPEDRVLADAGSAMMVNAGQRVVRHLSLLGLAADQINQDDVVTSGLEQVNVSSSGVLQVSEEHTTDITPLLQSSEYSMLIDKGRLDYLPNPEQLMENFQPDGERYILAARVTGKAGTAYPDGLEGQVDQLMEADNINVLLFADSDVLSDRLWVQVQDFFGSQIATPWADNGGLLANGVDQLSGSADLISLRSRGTFSRPFDVVTDIRRRAEERFRDSEKRLQQQLEETEARLQELQQGDGNQLTLTPEQEQALLQFQGEKVKIRKELRDVRHNLDKDIERLGTWLRIINIGLMPALITIFALAVMLLRARRRRALDAA